MHRLPLLLLAAAASAACDEAFGDGGDCAYEAVEPASCELVETADGLVLEATGEAGSAQDILLAEGDSCLEANGYRAGDTFGCAFWELTAGTCAPIDVMVEGPSSDCEF